LSTEDAVTVKFSSANYCKTRTINRGFSRLIAAVNLVE